MWNITSVPLIRLLGLLHRTEVIFYFITVFLIIIGVIFIYYINFFTYLDY
jgi:hypothetical protein